METGDEITVSARAGFAAVHQIADRLRGVQFPIELALPHRYDSWQEAAARFDEMILALQESRVEISTIHATQARITERDFLRWGRQTIEIAERFGAKAITVHPNRTKTGKSGSQELARRYLRQLQRETTVVISVETFPGKSRVFTPQEIMQANLPMTLDIAHISDDDQIMAIIRDYWQNIPVVHLSARGREVPYIGKHHLPIDTFCIRVVRELAAIGWSGSIALEYLPWHHYRLASDVKLIREALTREISPEEIPPICDAYKEKQDMWGLDAPIPESCLPG